MKAIEGKVPPHDLEAEAKLLGAVLYDPQHRTSLPAALAPSTFYSEAHARIFEAVQKLIADHVDVSVTSVSTELRDRGRITQVPDGEAYLQRLVDETPALAPSVVERLAKAIVDRATLRAAATAMHEALAQIYSEPGLDVQELLGGVERKMQSLSTSAQRGGFRHVSVALREEITEWKARADGLGSFGLSTGYSRLDRAIGYLQLGDLAIVAARPGMGKTSLITGCAVNVAKRGDVTGIVSLEMPARQLAARMLCTEAGLAVVKTRSGRLESSELTRAMMAISDLKALGIYIDDAVKGRPTVADICARTRRLAAQVAREGKRLRLLVVDYLQIVKLREDLQRQRQDIAIGEVSTELKALAKELEIAVVAVAQLNRGVETRQDKRPGMADLKDCGQIEQDADVIVLLYRDEYYNPKGEPGLAELIIDKNRNGPTGTVEMHFDGPTTRFSDLPEGPEYERGRR